jgi:hypothetical protein
MKHIKFKKYMLSASQKTFQYEDQTLNAMEGAV